MTEKIYRVRCVDGKIYLVHHGVSDYMGLDDQSTNEKAIIQISHYLNEQEERIKTLTEENEELKEEIARQKYTKHIMRENIKSYERAIKHLRKSYEEFDEMRLDRIRFLEKKLKKNGLSIYVNDCGDFE